MPCEKRVLFDVVKKIFLTTVTAWLLTACSSQTDGFSLDSLNIPLFGDDESDLSDEVEALEVPPDLDAPQEKRQFQVPGKVQSAKNVKNKYVLPQNLQLVIRREGGIAWLSANADPISLWPEVERFWRDLGFRFAENNPRHGYLVTHWRTRSPGARGGMFQDQYSMRMEREPNGKTNVYIANRIVRGAGEQARQNQLPLSDTEAELTMLQDLQDYLASSDLIIRAQIAPLADEQVALRMSNLGGAPLLTVGQGYSKVWRRLAIVLQRIGMTIRDADRARGVYVVDVSKLLVSSAQSPQQMEQQNAEARLLQIHLLAKRQKTVLTVHPHYREQRIDYGIARGVLQRIVNGYLVDEQRII